MKKLVFDSGPLISMTMNNLLWLFLPLKEFFNGSFLITQSVKEELVDNPLQTKKFKFEALQLNWMIEKKALELSTASLDKEVRSILDLANNCFSVKKQPLRVMQYAEASVLALAIHEKADAIVVDERITREFVEQPERLISLIKRRFSGHIDTNHTHLKELKEKLKDIRVLRSVDLVLVAFEKGLLDKYLTKTTNNNDINPKVLLESLLWGLKTDGCAISQDDIDYILEKEEF